jgi:hypothetical protein
MLLQNEANKRIVPSLTSEMEEAAKKELNENISQVPSYNQTRELIVKRLGGPFDYNQFQEDLRKMKVERLQIHRDFTSKALQRPDLSTADFGDKKAYYDFSTRPIDDQFGGEAVGETKVSREKPAYFDHLVKDTPSFMIQDMKAAPPQTQQQDQVQQPAQRVQSQPVQQTQQVSASPHKIVQQTPVVRAEAPQVTKQDLLTLKQ